MRFTTILAAAMALAFLAACDRGEPRPKTSAASGSSTAPRNEASPSTNTTPANAGAPNAAERGEGAVPPVQGREDTRQPEQRRDFKHPETGGK